MSMYISGLKYLVCYGAVFILQSCTGSYENTSSTEALLTAPAIENEQADVSEQIYQQATQESFSPDVSEVPLLSVRLLNYLARQNKRTRLCEGETYELLLLQYFPKLYKLTSQKYLVEQICGLGTYNTSYSYFLYQPSSLVSEVEMSRQPSEAYRRDEEGYYFLTSSVNQHSIISEAEITPLSFARYRYNDLGDLVRHESYIVSGRRLFEPSEEILSIFSKARGMADCGSFAHYQFQGSEFQLVEYRYQECCSSEQECTAQSYGRYPEEYPQIFP
ncbi:MAG: DUF1176 domain-containing protein [Cyanobacteria bacterium J06626_4]